MSGFVIDQSSLLTCPHSVPATPNQVDARVSVMGAPIVTLAHTYKIGCPTNSPCTVGVWVQGANKVLASGFPVAISTGTSQIAPPPRKFTVLLTQQRVKAT